MFWAGFAIGFYLGIGFWLLLEPLCEARANWQMIWRVPLLMLFWPVPIVAALYHQFRRVA